LVSQLGDSCFSRVYASHQHRSPLKEFLQFVIGDQIVHRMNKTDTQLYTIPLEDKFIIYAPLKRLAFIGNRAMADLVTQQLRVPQEDKNEDNKLLQSLKQTGLFEPDQMELADSGSEQAFLPTLCILMPTTACNLACTYCYADDGNKKSVNMKWDVAKKGIDLAFENSKKTEDGKLSLSFHGGGEPTLPGKFIIRASKYARKLEPECHISVTSNCVWEPNFRKEILDIVNEISVSFDGNKTTQNRQRPDKTGKGTFSLVMESLLEIEKRNIPYGIRMTVTKESLPELYSNIEFFCDHTTCQIFQVEAVYNQGKAQGSGLEITESEEFIETFLNAYDLAKSKGRRLSHSAARPHLITSTFCKATSEALIITSDGELTACYEVFDRSHPLADNFIIGKLETDKGLILYPEKRDKLLQKIADNRDECKDCFCYYHCAGDCPPKAFLARKVNDQFRCKVTRAITKAMLIDNIIEGDGIWSGDNNFKILPEPSC